jgi:2'-5' RNA ligase
MSVDVEPAVEVVDEEPEPEHHTVCVALLPADAEAIAASLPEGGQPADDLHCTLKFSGDVEEWTDDELAALRNSVEELAAATAPWTTTVTGVEGLGDDDPQAVVAMLDPAGGTELRDAFATATDAVHEVPDTHPTWLPHLTLGYPDDAEAFIAALPELVGTEVTFDRVAVWAGDDRTDYPLAGVVAQEEEPVTATETPIHSFDVSYNTSSDARLAAEDVTTEPGVEAPGDRFHTLIVTEGVMTCDDRLFTESSLTWRDPPLPFMATDESPHGDGTVAKGAKLVGNIDRVERRGAEIHGWGDFIDRPDDEAAYLISLIRNGELPTVSVDAGVTEFEVELYDDEVTEGDGVITIGVGRVVQRVTDGEVLGATAVPFPALDGTTIEVLTAETETAGAVGVHHTGTTDDPWDAAAEQAKLTSPMSVDTARAMYAWFDDSSVDNGEIAATNCSLPHHMVSDAGVPGVANMNGVAAAMGALNGGRGGTNIPTADRQGVYNHLAAHYRDADLEPPEANFSMVASAAVKVPVDPPRRWFEDPHLSQPTPLTVTDRGRAFGHVATWGECHIGLDGACIMPPSSPSNYARYRTGEVRCSDGSRIETGRITVGGLHADRSYGPAEAIAHYEDCALAVADVAAGEDAHGIWVSGALRPGITPEQVRVVMATPPSIDCRRFGSQLDLVNVHLVNVPGYVTPRYAFRKDGALVASAIISTPIDPLLAVPGWVVDSVRDRLAASIGRSFEQRRAELAARVHTG